MSLVTPGAPGIRAGWPKLAIRFVKNLPSAPRDVILERIGPARERIRETSFRDYVALEDFVLLADAAFGALGLVLTRNLWQEVMLEALRQPAIGELVRRAGVENTKPAPLLRRTADAFRFVHRNCGDWMVDTADAEKRKAIITLEATRSIVIASPGMLAVYWGNISAAFASLRVEAQLSVVTETADRRVRYRARW